MKKLRVLFAGNSHTYFNDMPQIFRQLAEAGQGVAVEATMQALGGVTYGWHLASPSFRYALLHGGYDYLFMQQAAHSPCPSAEETLADGRKLIGLARQSGVEPIVVVPWAERRFPAHQAAMYDTFLGLAHDCGARISPVGHVFERVLRERPDIDLYWVDGEHCSPYGSYVNAAMAYAVVFGASPVGLPALSIRHMEGRAEDEARVRKLLDTIDNRVGISEEMQRMLGDYFPEVWDREALPFELDEAACHTLQTMVWEAYEAHGIK